MRELKALYIKEMKGEKSALLSYIIIIIVLLVMSLLLKPFREIDSYILIILTLFPLWVFYISYNILAREWKDGSVSLWTGIPVKAWKLLIAKLAIVYTEMLIVVGLLSASILVLYLTGILFEPGDYFLPGVLKYCILLLPLGPATFGVYLSGTSIAYGGFLVRLLTGLLLLGFAVEKVFQQIIYIMAGINKPWQLHYYDSIPLSMVIFTFLIGAIGFILASRFLEKRPLP